MVIAHNIRIVLVISEEQEISFCVEIMHKDKPLSCMIINLLFLLTRLQKWKNLKGNDHQILY